MTVPPIQAAELETTAQWPEVSVSSYSDRSNVLDDLKSNLDRLQELHNRLQFMMGEIRGLLPRR